MKKQKGGTEHSKLDATQFFAECRKSIGEKERNRSLLLCIPIWGWTGAGKTCALLTAHHYADPGVHAIGFRVLSDRSEMERFEASSDEYRSLQLGALADTTKVRLAEISEGFIDKNAW